MNYALTITYLFPPSESTYNIQPRKYKLFRRLERQTHHQVLLRDIELALARRRILAALLKDSVKTYQSAS